MLTIERFSWHGWRAGLIADSAALMSREYAGRFGVGVDYEAWVTTELASFFVSFDAATSEWWTLREEARLVGCAAVDGRFGGGMAAEFRWFCLSEACRGQGSGRRVLSEAIHWAAERGFDRLALQTHHDLSAAVHLYRQAGFAHVGSVPGPKWAAHLEFQTYERRLQNSVATCPVPLGITGLVRHAGAAATLRRTSRAASALPVETTVTAPAMQP
jgi:GNAT superfamily N-acetyltransferase